jgi:hypothetical protein
MGPSQTPKHKLTKTLTLKPNQSNNNLMGNRHRSPVVSRFRSLKEQGVEVESVIISEMEFDLSAIDESIGPNKVPE